jgi:hypothetical protein
VTQAGSPLSAANGIYTNLLQGNAVLSAANPIFVNPGTGATFVLGAGTNSIGTVQPGNTANTTPWLMTINQGGNSAPVKAANTVSSTDLALEVAVANTNANGPAAASASSPVTPSNQPVGSANFTPTQVSCASTATQIVAARTGVAGTGRISDTITNTTTTAIYIGGSGVTTSTGALLPGVVGAAKTIKSTAALYCIVASGTATVTNDETY